MVGNLANYLGAPVLGNQSWGNSGGTFAGGSSSSLTAWTDPYGANDATSAAYDQAGYWTVGIPSNSPALSNIPTALLTSSNTYRTGSLVINANGTIGINQNWLNDPNEAQPFLTNYQVYKIISDNKKTNYEGYMKAKTTSQ